MLQPLRTPALIWDNEYRAAPALAESVESSSDALTWTVKLRQGVTFHNGKPVTPEDVLFTLQPGRQPEGADLRGVALAPIIDLATPRSPATARW